MSNFIRIPLALLATSCMVVNVNACERVVIQSCASRYEVVEAEYVRVASRAPSAVERATANTQQKRATQPAKAKKQVKVYEVVSGSTVDVHGAIWGRNPGFAVLNIEGLNIEAKVVTWGPDFVTLRLPTLASPRAKQATLTLTRENGTTAKSLHLSIVPTDEVVSRTGGRHLLSDTVRQRHSAQATTLDASVTVH